MKRNALVLAALSPANMGDFSPVQVQKLFFLIDQNCAKDVGGPHFSFEPYDYGPFDRDVYGVLEELSLAGMVEVYNIPGRRWKGYKLTENGQRESERLLSELPGKARTYITELVRFVRGVSFEELVSAIYKAYPEMKVNSVFKDA